MCSGNQEDFVPVENLYPGMLRQEESVFIGQAWSRFRSLVLSHVGMSLVSSVLQGAMTTFQTRIRQGAESHSSSNLFKDRKFASVWSESIDAVNLGFDCLSAFESVKYDAIDPPAERIGASGCFGMSHLLDRLRNAALGLTDELLRHCASPFEMGLQSFVAARHAAQERAVVSRLASEQ